MPQLQTLVLTDKSATPVAYPFAPRGVTAGVALFANSANGVLVGEKRLTSSLNETMGKMKHREVLTLPVVMNEVVNGVTRPTVVRTNRVEIRIDIDKGSTNDERKLVLDLLEAYIQHASFAAKVQNHEPFAG